MVTSTQAIDQKEKAEKPDMTKKIFSVSVENSKLNFCATNQRIESVSKNQIFRRSGNHIQNVMFLVFAAICSPDSKNTNTFPVVQRSKGLRPLEVYVAYWF